jgi:hypothetical protein
MVASRHVVPLTIGWCLYAPAVHALDAREVFKIAEPSIVVVLASDAKGEKGNLGSGVLVAPLEILTSCKVVESAADIVVTQGNTLRKAKLRFQDSERDLCQLQLEEPLPAGKPVAVRVPSKDLEVGQDVFLIASPRGLERTINRGMISGLRETAGRPGRLIQSDTAVAGGSIGGGLFDQEARLVGIITPQFKQGEPGSFAIPVDWIADLATRNPDRMTASADSPASASVAQTARASTDNRWHPNKGDRWRYRVLDGKRSVGTINIAVLESDGGRVLERITKDGSPGFSVDREVRPEFSTNAFLPTTVLPGGYKLLELSAYFPPDYDLAPGKLPRQIPGDMELLGHGKRNVLWDAKIAGRERIRVPAGEFDAWKIEATTQTETRHGPMKFTYRIWYSQAMQRAVKVFLDINSPVNIEKSSESLELSSYDKAK